jgi:hypothetical protein
VRGDIEVPKSKVKSTSTFNFRAGRQDAARHGTGSSHFFIFLFIDISVGSLAGGDAVRITTASVVTVPKPTIKAG